MARFEFDEQQLQHPGMALNDVPGKDAKIARLQAENFELRQRLQKTMVYLELAEEDRDEAIRNLDTMRENYARRCR